MTKADMECAEMYEDKVYKQHELYAERIITSHYHLNLEPGDYDGILDLKAILPSGSAMRVFFTLEDGRCILALAQWWQSFLGFWEIPVGSRVRLHYEKTAKGEVYLTAAEVVEPPPLASPVMPNSEDDAQWHHP